MKISRRTFLDHTAMGVVASATLSQLQAAPGQESGTTSKKSPGKGEKPVIISTWPFGKASNEAALRILLAGGTILDAVEQGIWVTESDATNSSVGLGGTPNAAGVVQLDACIMYGPGHRAGSVAGLEGIRQPISAARRVMEQTKHVMLVGEGARMFALEQGLESIETDAANRYQAWQKTRKKPSTQQPNNHDTIALLILGSDGTLAGGCSTSGLGGKLPGRVGDSPILGSGLYVDNEVGAAGATGIGENVMRYCGSFLVVEYMRQGLHPQAACQETIRRIARQDPKGMDLSINFVAIDKKGRVGAAGTDKGFAYSVTSQKSSDVHPNPGLGKA